MPTPLPEGYITAEMMHDVKDTSPPKALSAPVARPKAKSPYFQKPSAAPVSDAYDDMDWAMFDDTADLEAAPLKRPIETIDLSGEASKKRKLHLIDPC